MASTDIGPEEEESLNYSPSSPVCYLRYDGGTELKVMEKPSDSISNALAVSGTDVTPSPPTAATATSNIEKPFSPDKYTLFHSPGVGSTYTLALLILFSIPHDLVTLDYEFVSSRTSSDPDAEEHANSPDVRRLLRANKLAQFPTLVTPEGVVVTEMAGIALCEFFFRLLCVDFCELMDDVFLFFCRSSGTTREGDAMVSREPLTRATSGVLSNHVVHTCEHLSNHHCH